MDIQLAARGLEYVNQPGFEAWFQEYLKSRMDAVSKSAMHRHDDAELHRLQGQYLELEVLMNLRRDILAVTKRP